MKKKRYIYRCMKCRTRNNFAHEVEWYKIKRKCRSCGHKRFYVDKEMMNRVYCHCEGGLIGRTGPIPHRPGVACCVDNPDHIMNRALREGATTEDLFELQLDLAWEAEGGRAPAEPPF